MKGGRDLFDGVDEFTDRLRFNFVVLYYIALKKEDDMVILLVVCDLTISLLNHYLSVVRYFDHC